MSLPQSLGDLGDGLAQARLCRLLLRLRSLPCVLVDPLADRRFETGHDRRVVDRVDLEGPRALVAEARGSFSTVATALAVGFGQRLDAEGDQGVQDLRGGRRDLAVALDVRNRRDLLVGQDQVDAWLLGHGASTMTQV